jgi:hypothetical protein
MRLDFFQGNTAEKGQSRIYPASERNEPKDLDNLERLGFI